MEEKRPQSDEIDLSQIIEKIGKFFGNIGQGILRFIALIRRVPIQNKKLFIFTTFFILVAGMTYYFIRVALHREVYQTTMILNSYSLNKRLVNNAIEKLNLLTKEKERKGLSAVLNISEDMAQGIDKFDGRPFINENELIEVEVLKQQLKNAKTTSEKEKGIDQIVIDNIIHRIEIENRHSFEITIKVYNPKIIKNVQAALVNYFKNNDYVRKRIEIEKVNREERKTKLKQDLQKLDSLKAIIYENYKNMAAQSRQGSNNVILSDKAVTNPVEIYNQDLTIYSEYQSVNAEIYLQPDFEVVDGFVELHKPTSFNFWETLGISFLLGIVGSYLLVALIAFNKYLENLP